MPAAVGHRFPPTPSLSHHIINKLAVIVGNCQLLKEKAADMDCDDCEISMRIAMIESIAKDLSDELKVSNFAQ